MKMFRFKFDQNRTKNEEFILQKKTKKKIKYQLHNQIINIAIDNTFPTLQKAMKKVGVMAMVRVSRTLCQRFQRRFRNPCRGKKQSFTYTLQIYFLHKIYLLGLRGHSSYIYFSSIIEVGVLLAVIFQFSCRTEKKECDSVHSKQSLVTFNCSILVL